MRGLEAVSARQEAIDQRVVGGVERIHETHAVQRAAILKIFADQISYPDPARGRPKHSVPELERMVAHRLEGRRNIGEDSGMDGLNGAPGLYAPLDYVRRNAQFPNSNVRE